MKGESERVIGLLENVAERERERMREEGGGKEMKREKERGRERKREKERERERGREQQTATKRAS